MCKTECQRTSRILLSNFRTGYKFQYWLQRCIQWHQSWSGWIFPAEARSKNQSTAVLCQREPGESTSVHIENAALYTVSIHFMCTYKTWGVVIFHCLSIPERFKDGVGLQKLTFQFPLKKKKDFKAVLYRYKKQFKSFWTADFQCQAGKKSTHADKDGRHLKTMIAHTKTSHTFSISVLLQSQREDKKFMILGASGDLDFKQLFKTLKTL